MINEAEQTTISTQENLDEQAGQEQQPENDQQNNNQQNDNPPADENKDEKPQGEDKTKDEPKNIAPENYDFKDVQLPQGMTLDEDLLKEFTPLLKEDNLSQAQANRYMQLAVKLVEKQSNSMIEQIKQAQNASIAQYEQALNQDKEIYGGDKKQTDLYLDVADKGYNFLSQETRDELGKYGLNFCPSLIKDMNRLGKLFQNDSIPQGNKPVSTQESAAQILYGGN